jgi:hypothetical protein
VVEKSTNQASYSLHEIRDFSEYSKNKIEAWRGFLAGSTDGNLKSVIWGAGAKGVSFLNMIKQPEGILGVVDLNPRKQGKFIPVTAQPIFLPEQLTKFQPDRVLVMNPIYLDEIKSQLTKFGFEENMCISV